MNTPASSLVCALRKCLMVAIASAALAGAAHGAAIIWGPVSGITGDADVSTSGALVGAYNFAGAQTTVNGVSFAPWQLGATINKGACPSLPATGTYTTGNYALAYSLNNCGGDQIGESDTSSLAAPYSALSSAYRSLLGTAGSRGDKEILLTLGGLTAGQAYEIQFWVNDSNNFDPPGNTYPLTIDNTVDLDPNTSIIAGGLGQFVLGNFVADASSQSLSLYGGEVGIFNGFQLRALPAAAVPEPASVALVALGLIGLLATSRRSRPPRG